VNRQQFEHVLAAAASIVGAEELTVVGSQAILGSVEDAPPEMLMSAEADVYPTAEPARSDLIDGAIGDGSRFHATYGYYAHGVDEGTAKLPAGWRDRAARLTIPPRPGSKHRAIAVCPEPNDLVLSKCAAGRDRDWLYARAALDAGLVDVGILIARADDLPVDEVVRARVIATLSAWRTTT
jgi:hypothetical protein